MDGFLGRPRSRPLGSCRLCKGMVCNRANFCAKHNVRDPTPMVHQVLQQGPSPTIAQQDIPSINVAIAQVNRLDLINRNLGHWHIFSMSESMQLTSICRICHVTSVQPFVEYLINHHHVCPAAITRRVLDESPQGHNQVGIVQPFLGFHMVTTTQNLGG